MNLFKKHLSTAILITILAFSLFIRTYNLNSIPLGFHIDEASLGYNAYSLLLTGKDSDGNKLPLYISMFNDNNPTGYYYLATISIKAFGLNEFATRFPAALFGSLSVLAIYFLSLNIFKDKKISLLSSLLLAMAPWSIVLSRTSAETIVALFFIILGFAFIIFSLQNKNLSYLLSGSLLLFLSFFIYPAPRVFVPLFFLALISFFFSNWHKDELKYKIYLLSSFLFILLSSAILILFISGGTARFNQVSIFNFPETKLLEEEQIMEDGVFQTSIPITRFFHNKPINYSLTFASNYFQYFTGNFLFVKGGLPLMLNVPGMGLVYMIELPFILWGIISLAKHKNNFYKIPLVWLLIAPIAAALTVDDVPNVRRALVMFPAIEMIAAYGFLLFLDKFNKNRKIFASSILVLLLLFNFFYFLHQYFIHSQINKNWHRNVGFDKMVSLVKKDYQNYDSVIVTKSLGGIFPLVLFYMQYSPNKYQTEGSPKDRNNSGFGKFFFANSACPSIDKDPQFPKGKIIYVDDGNCRNYKTLALLKHIYITRKDGTKVFRIVYE